MIPFNKPYLSGKEIHYIFQAVYSQGHIAGNGKYTKLCHSFFQNKYNFEKCLLTTSCTDALEMAALLLDIKEGDEVIMPAFTFVSTANAFVLRGAKIRFCDSYPDNPNMDANKISSLINTNTKAIVVVHYAGVSCDMTKIMELSTLHNVPVIEDAAQAIDSFFNERPLGGIGDLSAFSFHETKNIISGEGGMLVVNNPKLAQRAEIIWEKGTNRSAFFRGEVDKYGWVDKGSSFLPSEIIAAFLFAQLESMSSIQKKRLSLWNQYNLHLPQLAKLYNFRTPSLPSYATNNAHMYFLVCNSQDERTELISHLKKNKIHSVFHYQSLQKSAFFTKTNAVYDLEHSDRYSHCLLRLPLFYELEIENVDDICASIKDFYQTFNSAVA